MELKYKKLKEINIILKDKITGFKRKILSRTFKLPNGLIETYFISQDKDSVCIFPITKTNSVILIHQFRPGTETIWTELPGGRIEPDEPPLEAAKRELLEEANFQSDNWFFLGKIPYGPYSSGMRHCFLAIDCEKTTHGEPDPNEFIETQEESLDSIKKMMKDGKMRNIDVSYLALDKANLL